MRPLVAWILAASIVVLGGPLLVVGELASERPLEALLNLSLLVLPVCGALLVNQQPRNALGWVFLAAGGALVFSGTVANGRVQALGSTSGNAWLAWGGDVAWPLGFPLLVAFGALLFPDGSPPLRARWLVPVGVAGVGAALVGAALAPWSPTDHGGLENPLASGPASPVAMFGFALGQLLLLATATGGVIAAFRRYRRGSPRVRMQLRLVMVTMGSALGVVAALRVVGLAVAIPLWVEELAPALVIVGLPVSVTVALLRYQLFDLDLVVNRSAVFLLASILLGAAYVLTVAASSWLLSSRFGWVSGCVAALVVAMALRPVVRRSRGAMDAHLFGASEDRLNLIAEFTEHAGHLVGTTEILSELAEAARRAVRAPFVEVQLLDGTRVRSGPHVRVPTVRVTIESQARSIGELVVGTRSASDHYTDLERDVLAALGRQGATAIHIAHTADELQRERARTHAQTAVARESLRRDLHDELGPRLAGVTYLLQALSTSVPIDDRPLLDQARRELQDAINDVRRMTHDLRPTVLEELGLTDAIRQHAVRISSGSELAISIDASDVPDLPDKVETALYRVALEALSNVGRHAAARTCVVRLRVAEGLAVLEIIDDGRGMVEPDRSGLGLASMGLRAEELGGVCEISTDIGTTVRVEVPIDA